MRKAKVQSWLVQKQEVLAFVQTFVQARPAHGGAGALVMLMVLLQQSWLTQLVYY